MGRLVFQFLRYAGLVLVLYQAFPAQAASMRLVAIGDSLTAGYGLPSEQGFTVRLGKALRAKGVNVQVYNDGVSGETTAGGLARLDIDFGEKPDAILLELGANDMLRGLPPEETERNLDRFLARLQEKKLPVLLIGMKASKNMGKEYVESFDAIYPRLAKKYGIALYPFFLEGLVEHPSLFQSDGLHPTARGVDEIVKRILPHVERLLSGAKKASAR